MKEVCRYVGWIMLVFAVVMFYGSRNADNGITTFILVVALVSSVFMLIYGYRNDGIKAARTERAVKELQWLINVSETEAHDIVKKWDVYCG